MVPEGLLEAALYVDDLERSSSFHQAVLGRAVLDADERIRALGVGGGQVLLFCRRGASAYFRDPDRHLIELATPGVWSIY